MGEDAQNTEVQGIYEGRMREHLATAAVALVRWDLKGSRQERKSRRAGNSDRKEGEKKLVGKLILML